MMSNVDGSIKRVAHPINPNIKTVSRKTSATSMLSSNDLRYATAPDLRSTAAHIVDEITAQSTLFDYETEAKIPTFHPSEIRMGHVIGRGGFCICQEIEKIAPIKPLTRAGSSRVPKASTTKAGDGKKVFTLFRLVRQGDASFSSDDASSDGNLNKLSSHSRDSLASGQAKASRDCVTKKAKETRSGRKCCYVVKSVSTEVSKITYMKGNVDIALEAKFLGSLSHRNIIELAGVSSTGPCSKGYFLILERMEETLASRLKTWMDRERLTQGLFGCMGGAKRADQLYVDRIEASFDIASSLQYIHSKNVIYRDLKPDNVGFDRYGVLKLFDFGLCKELKDEDKEKNGLYRNMTGLTGAVRYMAPEVGTGEPYGISADVYSWAMLMWFILALEPPFGLYTESMIMDRAWVRGYRPVVFRRWNENIQNLIRSAWAQDPLDRPSFLEISLALKQELMSLDHSKTWGSTCTSDDSDPQM
ncbi:WD-40 repeat-containing serine/threonine protein kinase [Nitzschia inconspicua]|uniref:WD-40 repeat-containing serine/threonine protein kinase n=1 Tax=Nitzschia inconspicua TaxID=303405 RepID=A0A9K3PT31_9STRA|nr:WD-40 repeat-containing serine/threonine protein kinase [Nitzschia inconspicua]